MPARLPQKLFFRRIYYPGKMSITLPVEFRNIGLKGAMLVFCPLAIMFSRKKRSKKYSPKFFFREKGLAIRFRPQMVTLQDASQPHAEPDPLVPIFPAIIRSIQRANYDPRNITWTYVPSLTL